MNLYPFGRCKIHKEYVSIIHVEDCVSCIDVKKCVGTFVNVTDVDIAYDEC